MPVVSEGSRRIVVADPRAFVRDRFHAALDAAGHLAIRAASAAELLESIGEGSPAVDLILLDVRLPDADGPQIVRTIRRGVRGRVPILIFSGTIAGAAEVRQLAGLGVDGYVNEHSATAHIMPALVPHLFPDRFNRRSGPRVAIGIPVQYRLGDTIAGATTLNLGRDGLALRTTSTLDWGTPIRVRFRLPGSKTEMEAAGRVTWSDARVGIGVEFEKLDAASQTVIDDFVDGHDFFKRS